MWNHLTDSVKLYIGLSGVNDSSCIIIDFDEKEIDNVINSISDYFIKKGLQKNCEPNCLGIELENLNDKFISVLQKINK